VNYERTTTNASDGSIHRYYDPATGQFLTVDHAVSETRQPYQFTSGDPTNGEDAGGQCNDAQGVHVYNGPCTGAQLARIEEAATKAGAAGVATPCSVSFHACVGDAVGDTGHWVESHKVAVGIGLGLLGVLSGGAGFIAFTGFEAVTAGTALGLVGVAASSGAEVLDAGSCVSSPGLNGPCIATVLGGVGLLASAPELGVSLGLITEPAQAEFQL
jgi:RHS repeat-associated protein